LNTIELVPAETQRSVNGGEEIKAPPTTVESRDVLRIEDYREKVMHPDSIYVLNIENFLGSHKLNEDSGKHNFLPSA
jgi:hypothetical protein